MKIATVMKAAFATITVLTVAVMVAVTTAVLITEAYYKDAGHIGTVRTQNQILAQVRVNGHNGFFLLDTGAQVSIITREFADKIGVTKLQTESKDGVTVFSTTLIQGINSSKLAKNVVVETFQVGTMPEIKNYRLIVTEKLAGLTAQGILGMDVLGQYRRIVLLKPEQDDGVSVITAWPDKQ